MARVVDWVQAIASCPYDLSREASCSLNAPPPELPRAPVPVSHFCAGSFGLSDGPSVPEGVRACHLVKVFLCKHCYPAGLVLTPLMLVFFAAACPYWVTLVARWPSLTFAGCGSCLWLHLPEKSTLSLCPCDAVLLEWWCPITLQLPFRSLLSGVECSYF